MTHKGPWCLEGSPERRPWMMKMVPTMMPTRPMVNPRAQTTVSVSSDIGAGISGSVKVKLWNSEYRTFLCMWVGWGKEGVWSLGKRVRSVIRNPWNVKFRAMRFSR